MPSDSAPDSEPANADDGANETDETDGTVSAEESEPAFAFAGDMQENIYVREGSWRELQDAINFETKRVLAQYGLRDDDMFKRELHDAMIRTAANHPEEIAHHILLDRNIATMDDLDGETPATD